MLNGLDLFSGYAGIARALSPWVRTVAYCENDYYRQLVLMCEMQRGRIDRAPIWDDVRTLRREHFNCEIDIITGGWPCKGHSRAGPRTGLDHIESKLAEEFLRIVCELRPRFVFFENVPGVLESGLDAVVGEFANNGYVGRYGSLSCRDVGPAWHERDRVWGLVADSRRIGSAKGGAKPKSLRKRKNQGDISIYGKTRTFTDSEGERLEGWIEPQKAWPPLPFITTSPSDPWPKGICEPTLCGKVDGPAEWIGQIETLGGGVVPQVAREAFERLSGLKGRGIA